MVKYSKVNVKLSNTQIKKLKDAVKNNTGRILRISLKMFNGNNLPHQLLLTTRLSKAQINKIIQSGGFLSKLLGPLLKTLPLIKNVIKPLAKKVLIPSGLTAAASATDAGTHKKY